jgi:LuxR family maltose regulon positive regulatory protein
MTPLLSTKTETPWVSETIIPRSRLIQLLDRGLHQKLTLLTAPVGYGKTTLLSEWVSNSKKRSAKTAWVYLDEQDNSPEHFFKYLWESLVKTLPSMPADLPTAGVSEPIIHWLINRLAETDQEICLILDNFHTITNPEIHNSLAEMLRHQPRRLHLYLSSREDLPFSLSRLRGQGQITEIHTGQMAFSLDETRLLCARAMPAALEADLVSSLHNSLEGWPAGIKILLQELQNSPNRPALIASGFAQNERLQEYLIDEVVERQTPEIQQFLAETALLDEFSAALCDAVRQRSDSLAFIALLRRKHLFFTETENAGQRWRYRVFFQTALKIWAEKQPQFDLLALRQRAIHWLRENGHHQAAISLALENNDSALAAEVLDEWSDIAIKSLDLNNLIDWVHAIPPGFITQYPSLGIFYAVANIMLFNYEPALTTMNTLTELIARTTAPEDPLRWRMDVLRVIEAIRYSPAEQTLHQLLQLSSSAPPGETLLVALMAHYLAEAYEKLEDYNGAIEIYRSGNLASAQNGMGLERAHSICAAARLYKLQGRLSQARELYEQALAYCQQYQLDTSAFALAQSGLIEIALERCDPDLDPAWLSNIAENLSAIRTATTMPPHYNSLIFQRVAAYYLAQGEFDLAQEYWNLVQQQLRRHAYPIPLPEIAALQTDMELCCLESNANSTARAAQLIRGEPVVCHSALEQTLLARKYLACGHAQTAIDLLSKARPQLLSHHRFELLVQIDILLALAWSALGYPESAFENLRSALTAAEQEGYTRIFLREGEALKALLLAYREHTRAKPTRLFQPLPLQGVNRVLAAFGETNAESESTALPEMNQISNLSRREIEVIRLLAAGKSTKEIAVVLMISFNTAKTHVKRIYAKLGIHNRREIIKISNSLPPD